jgi:polyisoprenyl-teichoic acid--peptidoglycan teichoic acid transferase
LRGNRGGRRNRPDKEFELRKHSRRRPILPLWLSLLLSVAFVASGLLVSTFVYLTAEAVFNRPVNPLEGVPEELLVDDLPPLPQVGVIELPTTPPNQPTPTLVPTTEPWTGDDRVTILVMGIDRRPGEAFISRTDTMMLFSLNPRTNTVSILSIPRDLYAVIPGRGRDRINTAFVYGSSGNNPAGGAALAIQTVERNLGVPVHHYLMVDFSAFVRGIDAIGGVTVDVPYNINDPLYPDMNYGYDPLFIPAGRHHFDGQTALKYARTRHQDDDFNRARRQQQILFAARSQALSLGVTGLLQRAPLLYQQLGDGIRTDLSLEQLIRLARTTSDIPSENIRNEVLDRNYVSGYRTEAGSSVLILNNEKAAPLIQALFLDS